ncbi:glycosyltransferase family 39 protein [Hydrogenimonas urashimensis]|uniref:glycosyltransferase family 39 protein n=1 Tax=Hydrogenimonas urashimensis TaxID=2740515 RepID=UPI0019168A41|nr:glycosyltransferase family 39 protein [Hydrogenimonas urashimensis]
MQKSGSFYNLSTLLLALFALSVYRFYVLTQAAGVIDLYADEAYYWGWAQHFDFGYYSKPPMVAWLIMLGTSLFGDTFVGIKVLSLFVYILTTLNIYFLAKELFDNEEIAFFSGLAFVTLPAVWLSSLIISTDVPFLFFWSLAMLFFVKALKSDRWRDWLVTGIAGGGGLLSKYTMIIFVVSAFAYLILSSRYRHHLKNPRLYSAMALAAILYMPNLYWNYTHEFVSFKHTSRDNAHITGLHFHLGKMLEFLGSQFGVFGPVLFGWLLAILPRYGRLRDDERMKLLWWFIMPMFALILTVSLLSRAFANWSAPMYVASTLLVVAWLVLRDKKRWLAAAIAVNIALGVGLYHYYSIAHLMGVEVTRKIDPFRRVRGWHELGTAVGEILKRHPGAKLLSDDRKVMAELIFYVHPHPFDAVKWNPNHTLRDHYEMTTDLQKHVGDDFIYVTRRKGAGGVAKYFKSAEKIATIRIPLHKEDAMVFDVYYLKHFKGYR